MNKKNIKNQEEIEEDLSILKIWSNFLTYFKKKVTLNSEKKSKISNEMLQSARFKLKI